MVSDRDRYSLKGIGEGFAAGTENVFSIGDRGFPVGQIWFPVGSARVFGGYREGFQ